MNSFETIGDAISKLIAYRMAQSLPDAPAHHLKIGDKIRTTKSGGEFLTVTYVVRNAFTGNQVSWIVTGEGENTETWLPGEITDVIKKERPMKRISLDNGHTFLSVREAFLEIAKRKLWGAVVATMDDETRERTHTAVAPCTNEEFLEEYLARADEDLIIG